MTAILVFSSPSFVPLLAAFMSCWTWSEEEDTRQRGSVRAECRGAGDLITYSAPLERETVRSGEEEVALSVLIMSLTICDSLWVAVPPLIREALSISQKDNGDAERAPHHRRPGCTALPASRTLLTTGPAALQSDPTGREHTPCGSIFK